MKTTFIYALCEPGTRTVRYIGKTDNLKRRLKEHLSRSLKYDSYLGRWLRTLVSLGQKPELIVLREAEGNGSEDEKRYIRIAKGCKMRLVNGTKGGDGGNTHPPGWKPSPETCALWSAQRRGGKLSESHCASLSASWTPERRAAASLTMSGENAPFFGKKHTKEELEKMSASHMGEKNPMFGKTRTSESRAKQSAAISGEKHYGFGGHLSEEHKASISASKKAANALKRARDQEIEWALAPYTLT